ncbi:ABC transporter permease [Aquimarina agarilytica]|uniref:ABC transporter permease n=1 Tax=Aquimarina agarilytica TaxID=1087449 RepID=UPI00028950FF|nr:ABC transporter permease [Aquimarina agarilytica]
MNQSTTSLSGLALQKFKRNFWSVLSLGLIVICGLIALFAYVLAPDNSQNANQMHLSIHSKPPGFKVGILSVPNETNRAQSLISKFFFGNKNSAWEYPYERLAFTEKAVIVHPYTSDKELKGVPKEIELSRFPKESTPNSIKKGYSREHTFILGTDKYGRDLLSRLLVGSRISFSIGFIAVLISLLIGVLLGALSGYFGGVVDAVIMWVINVVWSIPTLLLVIAITLALGKGLWQVYIAVGLTMWVEVARVVRGQVLSIKQQQYVTAAVTLGYSHARTLWYHVLPNSIAPVIVIAAANFASAILIESGLSFLGIGAQPPVPSWGSMIKDHYSYIILGKAYLAVAPGIAIMLLVMAFMLLGNGIRDALDVKS